MDITYESLLKEVQEDLFELVLLLKREDVFEIVKTLPEDIREHVEPSVEEAYERSELTFDIEYEGKERENIMNEINNQIDEFYMRVSDIRYFSGWNVINLWIMGGPYCPHRERIEINRMCPSCKKFEHHNINHCKICRTGERLEKYLEKYPDHQRYNYFVKRVCKACKLRKIQNETSAAA